MLTNNIISFEQPGPELQKRRGKGGNSEIIKFVMKTDFVIFVIRTVTS